MAMSSSIFGVIGSFDKLDLYLMLLVALFFAVLFRLKPTLPSITTVQTAVELLNTKGGIIALLGSFTMIFFFIGVKFIYWSTDMVISGKLTADNAVVISGFNWITGIAFGGAFGALIKTMTGESPPSTTQKTETVVTPAKHDDTQSVITTTAIPLVSTGVVKEVEIQATQATS